MDADHIDDFDSPFEKQVAEFLRQSGFDVVSQVGCSGYRIDLGVISPDDAGQFILGIECDGKNYHSAKTARDRDRLRESVLEGLGWPLHRIWSTDWFYNRETAQQKLLSTVNAAVADWRTIREARKAQTTALISSDEPEEPESYIADNSPTEAPMDGVSTDHAAQCAEEESLGSAESTTTEYSDTATAEQPLAAEATLDAIPVYVPTVFTGNLKKSAPFFNKGSDAQVRYLLRKVIETESPIAVDAALLRVAGFWGQNTLTSAVRERMTPAMRGLLQKRHQGKAFFWKGDKELDTYRGVRRNGTERDSRRSPNDIPPEEYANAIEWLVRESAPLSKEEVVRLLENTLHLDVGLTGCVMLEIGIELLIAQQRIMIDSRGTFTLGEQ